MFNRVLNTPLLLTIKYLQDIRKVDREKYNIGPENMVLPYSFVDSGKVNEYRHCVNNSCRKKQKQSARGILKKMCSQKSSIVDVQLGSKYASIINHQIPSIPNYLP